MTLALAVSVLLFIPLLAFTVYKLETQPVRVKREEERDASSDLS
jgi:hypothetical protein